jgi:SAM-dependent methyltransferase
MAGLLLYPLIIEVAFTLPEQARLIAGGYALLAVLAAICLFFAGKPPEPSQSAPATSWKQRGEWIFLAFVPSSLLLGVTTHITTEIIAAPLIWVVPMALYLLTWVIAFSNLRLVKGDKNGEIDKNVTLIAMAIAVLIMQLARLPWSACWHLMVFMIVALMYHIRLARARPEKTWLSEYYLMIALGGALGGALNAFVAPVVFNQFVEYPAMMLLACALHPALRPLFQRRDAAFYAFMASFAAGGVWAVHAGLMALHDFLLLLLFPLTAYIPRIAIPFGIAVLIATYFVQPALMLHVEPFNIIETDRNFYGVIKVFEQPMLVDARLMPVRMLQHGTTIHGYQVQAAGYEKVTPGYYDRNGPFGEVFDAFNPRRVAVVGLGAGAIACYGTPENEFTFFDIDPAMIRVAQTRFSFLSNCHAGKPHRLIEGDGRLKLAEETGKFDLIVLDAFSSDMVPAHLLTREAVQMYLDHLAPGGAILFHVSSRYIHLEELLAATANSFNIEHRWKQVDNKGNPLYSGSSWIVMAQQGPGIGHLDLLRWPRINPPEGTKPWTDDYSSVLAVLVR